MIAHSGSNADQSPTPPGPRPGAGLGDRLIAAGLITESQLELAHREQRRRGGMLSRILVDLGLVSGDQLSQFLAKEAEAGLVDLSRVVIDQAVLDLVPVEVCRKLRALPVARINGAVTIAMADPMNVVAIDTLHHLTGLRVEVATATEQDILAFLDNLQSGGETIQESIDEIIQGEDGEAARLATKEEVDLAAASQDEAPIIRLVNQIIARAVNIGASDVHFEPEDKMMRIRVRLDGNLYPDVLIPKSLQSPVTTRVKILADMDVAETRLPQDGRATVYVGRRQINLRVSSLPTSFGENIVVRILSNGAMLTTIGSLGMSSEVEKELRDAIDRPHGVLIVTGPTGSGKSTTLYAILREVSGTDVSTFTLEDPVEYRMPGVRQTQIKEEIGLTFSAGLRTLLRQDPDIILVGETRDTETAQLMVRAALTGHLVFTTLHTNDAPGAVPRLIDMGVEPFLLPEALIGVLAQRLVRRVCEKCREPIADPARMFHLLGLTPPEGVPLQLWRGRGCPVCKNSGYRGRMGIFELMILDARFHEPIMNRAGAPEYARLARERGMKTLYEDGLRRAFAGQTTLEEVLRVTRAG
ncbi:MAG TPA: ATPase, T2SS/T4P/T4SS family [Verrucomicrobiota bacterium]|nr:ATPase, T2SS/T4P/T4SS family [Verrucomicrobiota bacterium]HNU53292.1 ATPase, T2SS/T4P/T4SS family [Verrucomicrobiota bacterium]